MKQLASLQLSWHDQIPPLLQQHKGIAIACSGGVDSTVLFHLLLHFRKNFQDFPLALIHLNYQLRGEASDAAEAFVSALAAEAAVPCFSFRALDAAPPPTHHVQSWARAVRYEKFATLAAEGWLIALAHHSDD